MGDAPKSLVGREFRSILAIDLSMIGDLVMLSPALRSLRDAFPTARLGLLCQPFGGELFSAGLVDEVIAFDKRGRDKGFQGFRRVVRELRKRKYDCAFIFHKSFGSALIARLAGIPIRVGYLTEMRGKLLTHKAKLPQDSLHIVDENLNLLGEFGITPSSRQLEIYPDFSLEEHFFRSLEGQFLSENERPIIVICPHGGWKSKNWPISHINRFVDLFPLHSVRFVLVGAPSDAEFASHIYSVNNELLNLVGKTTLRELCYVVRRADLVISPDTSVVHIAQALGTPVIALFGPTPPKRCGPLEGERAVVITGQIKCQSLYMKECDRKPCCMETIEPETVKEVADRFLEQVRNRIYASKPA